MPTISQPAGTEQGGAVDVSLCKPKTRGSLVAICLLMIAAGHASALADIGSKGDVSPGSFPNDVTNLSQPVVVGDADYGELKLNGASPMADVAHLTNPTGYIGRETTGIGIVHVEGPGASWTNSLGLHAGSRGIGHLFIRNGATVAGGITNIAYYPQSTGSVTVTGAGSQLNTDFLSIGRNGNGALTILNGATVNSAFTYLGDSGSGQLLVAGTDSLWTVGDPLVIGRNGQGSLSIAGGANVAIEFDVEMGLNPGSTGSVSIRGEASLWSIGGRLRIGRSGVGSVTIEQAGTVQVLDESFSMASVDVLRGSLLICDAGSFLHSRRKVAIHSHTKLDVLDGGTIQSGGLDVHSSSAFVSDQASAELQGPLEVVNGGRVVIHNHSQLTSQGARISGDQSSVGISNGSQWTNEGDVVVGYNAGLSANGGSTIFTTGRLRFEDRGQVSVFGGSIVVGDGKPRQGFLKVTPTGILEGTGRIRADVENNGLISTGGINSLDAGSLLTIEGDYHQHAQGTLSIPLDDGTPSEAGLTVEGDAVLSGELNLLQKMPLERLGESTISILRAGQVSGTFDRVPELDTDLGFGASVRDVRYSPTTVEVDLFQDLLGDLEASRHVSQADLDLVLLNWGRSAEDVPSAWMTNLPTGIVDQQELDRVLLQWGQSAISASSGRGITRVPEPDALLLMVCAVALLISNGVNPIRCFCR